MGVLGAAMGLGVIAGPGLGGLLAAGSLSTPFFVAAGLSLISLFLAWFFLPESLPDDARAPGSVRDLFRLRRAQSSAVAGAARRSQWRAILRGPLGPLLLMAFLLSFGLASFDAIFGLYALEKFGYGPERVGTILMVVALVSAVGKGLLTGPATRRWGETRVIKGSLIAGAVGFILLALAGSYVTILLATGFFVLSKTLLRPCILALTSRRAPLRQGMAMGLSNTFMSLGRAVGPLWAGFIFDVNVNLPYLSGAAVLFLGFLASLVLLPPDERRVASAPLSEGEPMAQR
jgi:DHA1 family multidrug resistance protein-like MFS transporter